MEESLAILPVDAEAGRQLAGYATLLGRLALGHKAGPT